MVGNNSCGSRSLRYGNTRENVISVDALLADGSSAHFGPVAPDLSDLPENSPLKPIARDLLALGARDADSIKARFPQVQRRVGGYNIDSLVPGRNELNLAHILVGSEGTLGFSTRIELKLSPLLGRRAVGAVHFGSFHTAMDTAQHIVKLGPIAVELVDRTMLGLAREIAMFQPTIDAVVHGDPDAILFVEFAEDDPKESVRRLMRLGELIGDLGIGWDKPGAKQGGVIEVLDPKLQAAITEMRTAGLNIMMSMKEEGKPVSFVEDCAVPLEHLADYTDKLTAIFEKNGTRGTWYAHASVGCLHVRPVLNLRLDKDVKAMRAIAEEAFDLVRAYKGSHSGEHGDGIVRSEFHEKMFGPELVHAFEEVKDRFDPKGLFNPGKIVRAPKFDDRSLLRYRPDYHVDDMPTQLDWSAYPGAGGGFQGAVEMCNNNGACRALKGGVMCPSYRVTRDERDVTRGRANTLRLAISGQLGPDAFTSDEMAETMKLCVSCKACRRECPTGVDMARMKIEVNAARIAKRGLTLHDRLVGYLPHYAPIASRFSWLVNRRNDSSQLMQWSEEIAGFSAKRKLPHWSSDPYWESARVVGAADGPEVVLFADTFSRYFEPENVAAALCGAYRRRPQSPSAHAARQREAAAVLRAHVPVGRIGGAGAGRSRALRCGARTVRRARRPDRWPGAELHPWFPRRDSGDGQDRSRTECCLACADVRGIYRARGRRGPLQAAAQAHRQTGVAARPLSSEIVRRYGRRRGHAAGSCPISRSRPSRRAVAGWRAPSVTAPTPTTRRWRWVSCRCCLPCARPTPIHWWLPMAPPAATRSRMRPQGSRCTSPACWR